MSKKKKTILPGIRLQQFKDAPEWVIDKFGNLIIPVEERAGTKKYTLLSVTSGEGLIPQIEKFGREIAGSAYKNYYVIKKNDFAYNKSATKQFPEGYISMLTEYEEAALPNSIFTCFRIIDKECDQRFFDHLFHNNYHGSWLRKYIEVGSRAHGSLSVKTQHLWAMPIALPRLEEQKEIADGLSSLDDLINAEVKKLGLLKAYKKGLMQKLFPAEGETLPELRFPEFADNDAWVKKPLYEVGEIITGNTPTTTEAENYGGNKMFVSPADISDLRFVTESKTKLTEKGFLLTRIIPANSVLFVCIGSIGKVAQNMHECATNQQINAVVPFNDNVNDFIYYVLNMYSLKISQLAGKQVIPIINKSQFSSVMVRIPLCRDEQQKIADCLSTVDNLIVAQLKKIEALKAHKKGLMQKLFPSVEEVGGC